MERRQPLLPYLGLLLASVALSLTAFLFAGIPMLIMRRIYGWQTFVLTQIAIAAALCLAGLLPFALLYLVLTALISIYAEAREIQMSTANSGLIALLSGIGLTAMGVVAWVKFAGAGQLALIKTYVVEFVHKVATFSPQLKLNADILWNQLPSILAMSMIAFLTIAVLLERRAYYWVSGEKAEPMGEDLARFRVPEGIIWLAIAAVAGSFLDLHRPELAKISINFFNVLLFAYFLQGLAVVATFFRAVKVARFWQVAWYFVLVVQLFVLVSALGFSDYWLDYRERILRKTAESKKSV